MSRNSLFTPGKCLSIGFALLVMLVTAPVYSQSVPAINSVSPNSGTAGANVTISGTNFSATAPSNVVFFGAVQASVLAASPTSLQVTVPGGATFAPVTVTANGLTAYAPQPFVPTFTGTGQITNSSLAARLDLAAGAGASKVVLADVDGDGKPDLIIADASIGKISFYRNLSTNGSLTVGSFEPRVDLPLLLPSSGTSPYVISAADLDGDGRLDIIAINADSNVISILRNLSSPGSLTTNSFAARLDLPAGDVMRGLAVQDVNGDGKPDLVVANQTAPGSISIFQNVSTSGNIAFAARVNFVAGNGSAAVAVGDLDGDGQPDLAVASYNDGTVSVYRNLGGGSVITTNSFAPRVDFPALTTVSSIAIGDLDGDGKLDLAVGAGSFSGSQAISVFRNTATIGSLTTNSFAARVDFAAGWVNTLALADLDGDGKLDIALASQVPSIFSIFKNLSTPGSFTTASLAGRMDYTAGYNPVGLAVGDLDGDGRPDIAFGNFYDGTVSIYQNVTPFGTNTPPPTCTPPPAGLVGWWKGDGNTLDSVGGNNGVNQNVAYSNGVVGQAFAFDPENLAYGTYSGIQVADQPAYALTNSLTIEGWIRPRGDSYIIFWRGDHRPGLDPYYLSMQSSNTIFGICDAGGNSASVEAPMNYFAWTHLAATLDGATGTLSIYTNGVLAIQTNTTIRPFGSLQSDQSPGVGIGNLNDGGNNFPFLGDIDEIGLYSRALSASEIQAIYNTGSLGKCPFFVAPVIITQPTNQTVLAGGATGFSVVANGAQPLSYQWNFNGTNLSGATNSTLTLPNVQAGQAGNYAVLVTNFYGAVTSSIVSLTVTVPAVPPTILSQTPSQIVLLGSPATFAVNVSGSGPLSYFWSRDGALIPGATNLSYTLNNAQLTDSGSKFSCLVTNAFGFATSTNATLKVIDSVANDLCSGPVVVTSFNYTNLQSTTKATSFGDPVPGCVTGFGNGVWYQFTPPISGQLTVDTFGSDFDTGLAIYTGACDALTEMACNDDTGGMTSQVTIPTTAGTTYSILIGGYSAHTGNLVFHLNYLTPPIFAVQPTNQSVVAGSNVVFSATLTGAFPMSFQWFFNGTPLTDDGRIVGSTTASLSVPNITTADAGSYTLAATNFLGSASSAAAVLNVLVPATISTQPVGRSVPSGLPTTFSAAATGNPAPNYYQWQLNGTNIPGANSSTYTIAAVNTNHLGFYHLVASNSVGGTVSADAQLTFGQVAAWGRNLNNECLPPPNLSNVVGVAGVLGASFAVRTDGRVVVWGSGSTTNIPASVSNVVAISAYSGSGFGFANYALRADGTVVGWGGSAAPVVTNIVSVAAGNNFTYALRAEGTLTSWGTIPTPGFPAGLSQITAIAASVNNALALRSDGKIFVSGTGTMTNVPASATNVIAIAGGYTYAMALRADGRVIAWGSGTITNLPAGLTNIVAISAGNNSGENFALAVRDNGKVLAWGDNGFGQTNPPAALTNLVSIAGAAAPFHGLALVNDGSPVIIHPPIGLTTYTGRDVTLHGDAVGTAPLSYQWLFNGTNVPGATNTSLVLANLQFANAGNYQLFVSNAISTAISLTAPVNLISNGPLVFLSQVTASATNVYQGGKVTLGGATVLGSGPLRYQWFFSPTNKNYTAFPGATNDTLALDPALVVQSGNYYISVSNQVSGITSAPVSIKVLFAKTWGYLATDPPFNVSNATAIAVGSFTTSLSDGDYLVLKSDGKILSWGRNVYGETNFSALSNSIVTAIAAGDANSLALKSDGTVFANGYNGFGQTNVPNGLNGVIAVACGDSHNLALKADGTFVGWGQNTYGELTNAAATNVVAIAAGGQNSLVLRADGSVYNWGFSGNGGNGSIPTSASNVIAIACGTQHFLALRANGTVVGWGQNTYGQNTIPASWTNIVAISAAANHSVALRNDGTVLNIGGYNGSITSAPPADLTNVIAIASGSSHDLALFGTRAPVFTVQPWNRAVSVAVGNPFNLTLAGKCSGVQPVSYQWRRNGTNIVGATNDLLSMSYNGQLNTGIVPGTYQLVASNGYGLAISQPAKVTIVIPLAVALDTPVDPKGTPAYNWITSGSAQWFGQTNITHDDVDAARSGGIGAAQETILQTTVGTNFPGHATFWWKVSSEQFFDTLEFRVNGTVQASLSGEADWQLASIALPAGTNVLQWRYSKDYSFDAGLDAAFVDQFAFVPDPPVINVQPQPAVQTVNLGANVSLSISAVGALPMKFQWWHDGNAVGGSNPTLTLNNVARAQAGTYSVTVTNTGGVTVSSNALLIVHVPQVLGSPKLMPDGSFQLTSSDANGGLLQPSDLANFEAQASTNLVDWVTLPGALSLTNGTLQLQDGAQPNYNARYYRIIEH